jgi:tetratricopeptide (TPR) repeat protein
VQRLEAEHDRLHIDISHLRCERWPTDWQLRVELAARLMLAGNFSGALQRLEEARRLAPEEPAILLALGEGWQHLRQFDKALEYYEQAAARLAPTTPAEVACRVDYRAAVLAEALGQPAAARRHLQAVVAREAAYKDAAERLRRLGLGG